MIVIGASAGGVEAVTTVVRGLPGDLNAAVLVVIHFPSYGTSLLDRILSRQGGLQAIQASDGLEIQPGHIYVPRPDYHMLVEPGRIVLSHGPLQNGHRPAIDPFFRSAALAYGPRIVGVVLSGTGDDGTEGLLRIKQLGGVTVAQDPGDAVYPDMPKSAIEFAGADFVLEAERIPELLVRLTQEPANGGKGGQGVESIQGNEAEFVARDKHEWEESVESRARSVLTCPDCGGVLWEIDENGILRFRCHVGHAYTVESLFDGQGAAVETALWTAVRALEERASLLQRMAHRARGMGHELSAGQLEVKGVEAREQAELIRRVLLQGKSAPIETGQA